MSASSTEGGRALQMLLAAQKRSGFPLSAIIELTRRCNLRCAHCYLDLDHQQGLDSDELRRVMDELAEAGTLFLTFTGGEIGMRPDWLELARDARERGFALRLKTNGTLMTAEDVRQIARLPVLAVDVSLYGHQPDVHDGVTGRRGSFDRTMATVLALRAEGVRVSLRLPVLSPNVESVGPIIELASELGCELVADTRICPTLDAQGDNSAVGPARSQVERAVEVLQREVTSPLTPRPEVSAADNPWPCLTFETSVYVRADGELWRCPILPISFGSVREGPIAEVWARSEERRRLVQRARRAPEACRKCDIAWACQRCPGQAWLEHGTLDEPASVDCRLAEARSKGVLAVSDTRCDTCLVKENETATVRRVSQTETT